MRQVWAVGSQPRPVDGAVERFGRVNLVMQSVSPLDVGRQEQMIAQQVFPQADADDLVLMAGPTIMVSTFISAWTYRFGFVRMLVWDRDNRRWVERYTDASKSSENR